MELKNKKIACLGDSITEGLPDVAFNYVHYLEELSGAEVMNFGVSATRIATRLVPHEIESRNESFLLRAEKMTGKYDVILIFGGTNDCSAMTKPTPIGDISSTDEYEFYGALKILYNKVILAHPEATVVVVTPLHRENEKSYGIEDLELVDYVKAIREIASWYSLPVIDLWNNSGIQAQNVEIMKLYLRDGLHPTQMGAKRIAERIYGFLKSL